MNDKTFLCIGLHKVGVSVGVKLPVTPAQAQRDGPAKKSTTSSTCIFSTSPMA